MHSLISVMGNSPIGVKRDPKTQVGKYEKDFFISHVDQKVISVLKKFYDISFDFESIISSIDKRNKQKHFSSLFTYISALKIIDEKIVLVQNTIDICLRIQNSNTSKLTSGNLYVEEMQKICEDNEKNSKRLSEAVLILKNLQNTKKDLEIGLNKIRTEIEPYNANIERWLGLLKESLQSISEDDFKVLKSFSFENLREEFKQGLMQIMHDEKYAEIYTEYTFKVLGEELKSCICAYQYGKTYALNASKENDYIVPELEYKMVGFKLRTSISSWLNHYISYWMAYSFSQNKEFLADSYGIIAQGFTSGESTVDAAYALADIASEGNKVDFDLMFEKTSTKGNDFIENMSKIHSAREVLSRKPDGVNINRINSIPYLAISEIIKMYYDSREKFNAIYNIKQNNMEHNRQIS